MSGVAKSEDRLPISESTYPFEDLERLATRFRQLILDRTSTWETAFDAGPGDVVSVSDAAQVLARAVLDGEATP